LLEGEVLVPGPASDVEEPDEMELLPQVVDDELSIGSILIIQWVREELL